MDNYKSIRSKMTSPENTNEIVKKIAIEFAKWTWTEQSKNLLFDSYNDLFDYWLNSVYLKS